MKLYIYTTRYIDKNDYYFLFCLDTNGHPVTMCIIEHETYIYVKSKHRTGLDDVVYEGDAQVVERELRNIGIVPSRETEIMEFNTARLFSFEKAVYYKVYVKGYSKLLKAEQLLPKKGYQVADFPRKEAKFFSDLKLRHTQWIDVDEERTCEISIRKYPRKRPSREIVTIPDAITSLEDCNDAPPPVLEMAFDLEAYSPTYGIDGSLQMPNSAIESNIINILSCVITRSDSNKPLRKICWCVHREAITLAPDPDTECEVPVEVICVDSETDLLKAFFDFIRVEDPDVIYGHNSSSFDFKYIASRCEGIMEEFESYGRLQHVAKNDNVVATIDGENYQIVLDLPYAEQYNRQCWEGAGSKWHEYHIPVCYGRIVLDTLIMFRKLPTSPGTPGALQSHGLENLGKYLLGESKTGMTYAETFYAYRSGDTKRIAEICAYCVQDSRLCMRIYHKGGEWIAIRESANVYFQDTNDVTITGQTAKMYTCFLRTAEEMGYMYHRIENTTKMSVQGGHVEVPIKGTHTDVAVIDFASLYPSIMMAYGICPSTFLRTLPPKFPEGWSVEDFTKYEIPVEVGRVDLPGFYDDARDPDGEEIDPDRIDDSAYIDSVIKSNDLNPEYKDSYIELLKDRFRLMPEYKSDPRFEPKTIYENMVMYFVKKERRSGILPAIEAMLKQKRTEAKQEMKKSKTAGDMVAFEMWNQRQMAIKVVMNSIYGVLGSQQGAMSFPECAAAITYIGRSEILRVKAFLEERNYRIIYGDTDSLMFQVPNYGEEERSKEDPPRLSAPVGEGIIEKVEAITEEINATMIKPMKMEFEKLMNAVFVDRKRYMGYITYEEGKNFATPGVESDLPPRPILVRGAAAVRGDTTPYARVTYTEALRRILSDNGKEDVMSYIDERVRKLHSGEVSNDQLSVSKMLSHSYAKDNAPMKVYAEYLHKIGERADPGTKIPLVIVKPGPGQPPTPKSLYYRPPTTTDPIDTEHYAKLMVPPIMKLVEAAYL